MVVQPGRDRPEHGEVRREARVVRLLAVQPGEASDVPVVATRRTHGDDRTSSEIGDRRCGADQSLVMDGAQPGEFTLDLGKRVVARAVNAQNASFTRPRIVEPVGRVLRDVEQRQRRAFRQTVVVEGCLGDGLV
jgi:hypothetical protein